MKSMTLKSLTILTLSLGTLTAGAAPAVDYTCVGTNLATREPVQFQLMFSDHDHDVGYTNEAITVTHIAGKELATPVIFQMFGATKQKTCRRNEQKELLMSGKKFSMDPAPQGASYAYDVKFKVDCGTRLNFNVVAQCKFN